MNAKFTAEQFKATWTTFLGEVKKLVVGNDNVLDLIGVALFVDGHIILQSFPGLGKTVIGMSLGTAIRDGKWGFFQFTADLLPSDVKGSEVLDLETNKLKVQHGAFKPWYNVFVADEINRATPKTNGSLLAIMEERRVVIGDKTFTIADPSLVIATQNPIEQEGTYPLPEAMLDRFPVMGRLDYLTADQEFELARKLAIYERDPQKAAGIQPVLSPADIIAMREFVKEHVTMTDSMVKYAINLIRATRPGSDEFSKWMPKEHRNLIQVGASQRTTKWLTICSRAAAALRGSDRVEERDIQNMTIPCLGHKLVMSPDADAIEGVANIEEQILTDLLKKVPVAA